MTSKKSAGKNQLRLSQRLKNSIKLRKPVANGVLDKLGESIAPLSY